MDSYKVFQSICLALVLSCARAGDKNTPCSFEKGRAAVRLTTTQEGGRAEVMCEGEWNTISNENWNDNLTNIFCNELGFKEGKRVTNVTMVGQGPVSKMQCTGDEVSMRACNFTKLAPIKLPKDVLDMLPDLPIKETNSGNSEWNHTNDVVLKCFQSELSDYSRSSSQKLKGQSNMGQDSPDAVVMKKTSPSNLILLVVVDGIEFVLLFVAAVFTGWIVYNKVTRKMMAALKEKRSPETQAMLDLSQVTVQQPTAPEQDPRWGDPQEGQPWRSGGESVVQNPVYGKAEKY